MWLEVAALVIYTCLAAAHRLGLRKSLIVIVNVLVRVFMYVFVPALIITLILVHVAKR